MSMADLEELSWQSSAHCAHCRCLVGLPSLGIHGQLRGGRKSKAWEPCACTQELCLGLGTEDVPKGKGAKGC